MRIRVALAVGLAVAAAAARAQDDAAPRRDQSTGEQQQQSQAGAPTGPTSGAFDQACIDLLHGRTPQGEAAISALRDACSKLMSGRADERIDAEKRRQQQLAAQEQLRLQAEGRVQPGQSSAQPQQGQGVRAAFETAGRELTGRQPRDSSRTNDYLLVTNPVGWFSGLGVNATLFGTLADVPKLSWVAGARYAATDTSNGTASTFGALGGIDFFMVGGRNQGLRLGPRVEVAAGRERIGTGADSTTFARMGLGGELGYNFIASNGIGGTLAFGLGGRVAGDSRNESFSSFVGGEFGPYVQVGVGYGW